MRLEGSHKKSFKTFKYYFKCLLVPEQSKSVTGYHYVFAIDSSGSMDGLKIGLAKESAENILKKIPSSNKVTVISFSKDVETIVEGVEPQVAIEGIKKIKAEGPTPLYTAVNTAFSVANKYNMPTRIIILTDGKPTDEPDVDKYRSLVASDAQVVAIGVGDDYNEDILKAIVDATNGVLYHLNDPSVIPEVMIRSAPSDLAAKDVSVDVTSPLQVKILNYSGMPVKISGIDKLVRIYGEITVPDNYSGEIVKVSVSYEEPDNSNRERIDAKLDIYPAASIEEFISGVKQEIIAEYKYMELLNEYQDKLIDDKESTKTLSKLEAYAEKTKNIELKETTKRLRDAVETTKRLKDEGTTKRVKKEVASEVTKRMRGG
ncbi:hypothetical protein HS7_11330 [Sulfolobales archaeon HS-7]|nr:hypothetical protein HS7_11330 [Sulfolobales archaeon HS-7]